MPPGAEPILIVGTGALASLFAARLSANGQQVQILGSWQEAIDAFNRDGVHLRTESGKGQHYAVRATREPADCADAHYALLLVKSWQTVRKAEQLLACLADDGLVLSLQNGIGNREILIKALGAQRVALGSTTTGAALLGPAEVRPGGEGVISLGAHPQVGPLANILSDAGFTVETQKDIDSLIWSKLVINAAINPLTALLNIPNGELLTRPTARQLSAQLAREVAAVAHAKGIKLSFEDPVQAAEDVAHRTSANRSSMLQDVDRGAPTEIEAICGEVARAGEEQGIPTPLNETMRQLITALGNSKPESEGLSHVEALP